MTKGLPKGLRKFIRKEKSRIRLEVFNLKEQERLIGEIYRKFAKIYESKRNLQLSNKERD
jgi:hypothetical protein